jgi:muramoyltetrapeptide carboxypeptidase
MGGMRQAKPKALKSGDRIGVVAPSGPLNAEKLQRGCEALRAQGYDVVLGDYLHECERYFAGRSEHRACDLNRMLRREDVHAVLCARGGYGASYLLSRVELGELRHAPKLFGGYSDATVLLTQIHDRAGIPVLHAPLVTADWGREDGVDLESWHAVVSGGLHMFEVPVTLHEGVATGKLYGGCLSLLASTCGTLYGPCTQDTVLFLEDVNEPVYKIDRMLRQLELAGKLGHVNGIVFGTMANCGDDIAQQLEEILHWFKKPIAFGLPSGHVTGAHQTLAFGVQVRLDARVSGAKLEMLEAAVEA